MAEDPARTRREPVELVDRLACRAVSRYGAETRNELIAIIESFIDDGNIEMARLWTRVLRACDRRAGRPDRTRLQ